MYFSDALSTARGLALPMLHSACFTPPQPLHLRLWQSPTAFPLFVQGLKPSVCSLLYNTLACLRCRATGP